MEFTQIFIMGNINTKPILKTLSNSNFRTSFQITVFEKGCRSNFIIVCWGALAETVCQYLEKGDKAYIRGTIQMRFYEEKPYIEVIAQQVLVYQVNNLNPYYINSLLNEYVKEASPIIVNCDVLDQKRIKTKEKKTKTRKKYLPTLVGDEDDLPFD